MVEIMKASAGSGKTFNLARKYITLLFKKQDKYAYRHILAVTFTNKATDEMKSRILKELYILSSDPRKSGYLKYFIPEMFTQEELKGIEESDFVRELPGKPGRKITLESLAESAKSVLCGILHDYSAFSVSTIDKFFQQTLKAFSREIGQFASYKVELDKNSLVAESVDRVLDALTEKDVAMLKWLTDSVMENIEQGGRYNLEGNLVSMASRLKSDEHREMVEKSGIDESVVYSKENLSSIRKCCNDIIKAFIDEVQARANAALQAVVAAGVSTDDFNRKFLSALYSYAKVPAGTQIISPSDSFLTKAGDPEQWFAKSKKGKFLDSVRPLLESPLNDFCEMFGTQFKVYNTAVALKGQLYSLGVAGELYREFNALMKEKNVLSIDDSNTILKGIIDGSDAPFVYEKLGVRYENFLLDEFQDTSGIQWENFRPLLENSESQGFESLVVGDVKQSIYRWRGSDWNLFHSDVQREFPGFRSTGLDTNYRSLRQVIEFNNAFFLDAAKCLDIQLGEGSDIESIYSDVAQKVPDKVKDKGVVEALFCKKESENANVLSIIRRLVASGVNEGDIAILVRNNATGADIASFLISNGINVLTDDSLKVKSSVTVRRLVSLLSYADNPDDTVNSYLAGAMSVERISGFHSLVDLCESLLRDIRGYDSLSFDSEILYIQSFMDAVQDYASVSGNDLHGFLKAWGESDPAISSPSVSDAVRIMTVHKSKGLAFPYVIFPYVETVNLFKPGNHWCSPDFSGTALEGVAEGLYDVNLSSGSVSTLFEDDYRKELKMQYVDNINAAYVAFTRAERGLFLVAKTPSAKFLDEIEKKSMSDSESSTLCFSDFSQILYWYIRSCSGLFSPFESVYVASSGGASDTESGSAGESSLSDDAEADESEVPEHYVIGEMPPVLSSERKVIAESLSSEYPSWPVNGDAPEMEQRLKFKADGAEFFSSDGSTGVSASARLRGIVLHDILSSVIVPSDLEPAVENAFRSGILDREEADEALCLLSERIRTASGRGWFPENAVEGTSGLMQDGDTLSRPSVRNEAELIDIDGSIYRPDRVVINGGKVTVIDYKFGEHKRMYDAQVAKYADLYRRMGYASVTTALWYVFTDEVRLTCV